MLALMLAQVESLIPTQGVAWSGWSAVGVLVLVLVLMFRHLKTKDAQIMSLLKMQATERELDRAARHASTSAFQETLSRMENRHREESEADRELFRESLAGVCQFERRHGCADK